jgi:hypothetical protein
VFKAIVEDDNSDNLHHVGLLADTLKDSHTEDQAPAEVFAHKCHDQLVITWHETQSLCRASTCFSSPPMAPSQSARIAGSPNSPW